MKISAQQRANLLGHQGAVYALERGPEPGMIFSGGADKMITAWDLLSGGNLPFLARLPSPVYSLCYVPEKNLLIAGTSSGAVHLIDLSKKEEVKILRHHTAQVFDIRYSSVHGRFYTLGGDGTMAVCSIESLSAIRLLKLSSSKLRQMDMDLGQTELAIACGDGDIHILDAFTLQEKYRFNGHEFSANAVRFHPNGKTLLTGGKDAFLKSWNRENQYAPMKAIPAHNFAIYRILFSPDGLLFATASRDKTLKIWNASDLSFLLRLDKETYSGHVNSVNTLIWTDSLVSAGDDRSLLVWEIKD